MLESVKGNLTKLQASIERFAATISSEAGAVRTEVERLDQGILGPLARLEGLIKAAQGDVQAVTSAVQAEIDKRKPPR